MLLIFLMQQGAVIAMPHSHPVPDNSGSGVADAAALSHAAESSGCHTAATDQDRESHRNHRHDEQSCLDECDEGCRGECNDCLGLSVFVNAIDGTHLNFEPGHPKPVVYAPTRILRAPENPFRPPILR